MSDLQATDQTLASAGTMLRQAREAAGLHVAALAVAMKVPVKKLEALEADRMDLLPDAVFVRALASSVCRSLKIDAAPVLAKLPQNAIPRLDAECRGINAPFHTPGQNNGSSALSILFRPAVAMVILLLVAAVVIVFLPDLGRSNETPDVVATQLPVQSVEIQARTPVAEAPESVVSVTTMPPAFAASAPTTPAASAPAEAPKPAVVASAPANKIMVSPGEVETKNAGPIVVGFKVRGPSWVEVTDAKGTVQLRKTMAAGEFVSASGALPLSVVVGRADVTDVEVRGKAFSLAGLAKDNVARFEVK